MKKKIAVFYGGRSSERDISLLSGKEVVKNLDKKKYEVFEIEIEADGITWKNKSTRTTNYSQLLKNLKIDIAFIALHGELGEDGTLQGLLEILNIKYTGSGVLASALAIDKIYSKTIFIQLKLKTPKCIVVDKKSNILDIKKLKLPLFVKPALGGSSIGNSKVTIKEQLLPAIKNAQKYGGKVLVEEYIDGTEITCAILGNADRAFALPLIEIVSKNEFFDYKSKYDPTKSDEICPARISKPATEAAQKAALVAYRGLGCSGFGRVDMILKNKDIYVLEVNTIPGLTPVSLLPKAAKTAKISYSALLNRIIKFAIND